MNLPSIKINRENSFRTKFGVEFRRYVSCLVRPLRFQSPARLLMQHLLVVIRKCCRWRMIAGDRQSADERSRPRRAKGPNNKPYQIFPSIVLTVFEVVKTNRLALGNCGENPSRLPRFDYHSFDTMWASGNLHLIWN